MINVLTEATCGISFCVFLVVNTLRNPSGFFNIKIKIYGARLPPLCQKPRKESEEQARKEAEELAEREAEEQARREAEELAAREAKKAARKDFYFKTAIVIAAGMMLFILVGTRLIRRKHVLK